MSQFIINRNNMQDVREMCAFFAKEHKYEIERLAWQCNVLERKAFKYWRVYFDNRCKSVEKIKDELNSWFGDAKARYNHIINAVQMCVLVERLTNEQAFEEMYVNSVDMDMVGSYFTMCLMGEYKDLC